MLNASWIVFKITGNTFFLLPDVVLVKWVSDFLSNNARNKEYSDKLSILTRPKMQMHSIHIIDLSQHFQEPKNTQT